MQAAFNQFLLNINRIKGLGVLYKALNRLTTVAVDSSDILRAQIVMAVSALDHYIHEVTRIGMLEVYSGNRSMTPAFKKFGVTMNTVMNHAMYPRDNTWFEAEIRERHSFFAFQQPDKIADAVRLFSDIRLWQRVSIVLGVNADDVKDRLRLIVDRRNKIVHEADLDPSYPGARWPISEMDVNTTIDFIESLCAAINQIIR